MIIKTVVMPKPNIKQLSDASNDFKVGIIGGGIAGAAIALRLAELNIPVTLIEKGPSLVNGPPICHLHAGGNLYREISDQQCLTLLRQSIDTLKVFHQSANIRPTVIAIPKKDKGTVKELIPRLDKLKTEYARLVSENIKNQVLGKVEDYYKLFSKEEIIALSKKSLPEQAQTLDDWLIPVAKTLDLNQIKFPVILVQEYGLNVFRLAAIANLAAEKLTSCQVLTDTKVTHLEAITDEQWQISTQNTCGKTAEVTVDYLINACGFKTGEIDDMLAIKRSRMVEFKAAYVTHWKQAKGHWPEVVFYGERGTPQGMAQLTPYADGYFQLHGMTEDITLFKDGLVTSSDHSSQPQLPEYFIKKIEQNWLPEQITARTHKSIAHVAQFMPAFGSATEGGKPLFGAQQIPGDDPELRAADVSFANKNYARSEIVKASSALDAANAIIQMFVTNDFINKHKYSAEELSDQYFPVTLSFNDQLINEKALSLAKQRQYPAELAKMTS